MAESTKRTLTQKLGYKSGQLALVLNAPKDYWNILTDLPEDLTIHVRRGKGPYELIHLFVQEEKVFVKKINQLTGLLAPTGCLWISWPKGSSSLSSNINRDFIRAFILQNTVLVDCKVVAVDDDWSGLKFMIRKTHR